MSITSDNMNGEQYQYTYTRGLLDYRRRSDHYMDWTNLLYECKKNRTGPGSPCVQTDKSMNRFTVNNRCVGIQAASDHGCLLKRFAACTQADASRVPRSPPCSASARARRYRFIDESPPSKTRAQPRASRSAYRQRNTPQSCILTWSGIRMSGPSIRHWPGAGFGTSPIVES